MVSPFVIYPAFSDIYSYIVSPFDTYPAFSDAYSYTFCHQSCLLGYIDSYMVSPFVIYPAFSDIYSYIVSPFDTYPAFSDVYSYMAADTHSTSRILVAIVKMCFETKNWDALNENIVLLTKRRGQIKQSVTKMIQEACTYVDKTPSKEVKLKLIDTLRSVTAGKIYVEIERARLTRILAKIREDDGDINGAATVLQELQVETFGSMEKKEKVEFILEQMRLCLAKKDYIRTQIISKKVSTRFFEDADTIDLKLKFYQLMIELDQHEGSYLAICKHYMAIYNTEQIQKDKDKMKDALRCVVLYLVLAPFDNEQSDLLHRVSTDKNLEEIEFYQKFLNNFNTNEIIKWGSLCKDYESGLKAGENATFVFSSSSKVEGGEKRWADLKNRVVEHNIRVMAKYYTRIRMQRMATLLDLAESATFSKMLGRGVEKSNCNATVSRVSSFQNIRVMAKYYTRIRMQRMATLLDLAESETEEFLSNLVVNKTVQAKIDRLEGVVSFSQSRDPNSVLNGWSNRVSDLMHLIHKTNHLINKENMVHRIAPASAKA
ncbi:26S proteasome non-ATPase regulatory subunit 12 [Elysia marginata]|uniref:26S proteasome non-ATPase regulatory subunit 12 n=1 Tax=Elysia marginata TaxID=1093978 RepID=A0AAV4EXL3_9GAST|nr:26S proteasome non-ATPase regulatory subunit 12 [Elysia marginata]